MKKLYYLILLIFLPLVFFSQEKYTGLDFIENKGQWDASVKYKLAVKGGHLYFLDNSIVYNVFDLEDINAISEKIHHNGALSLTKDESLIDAHAFKVLFQNANTKSLNGKGEKPHYYNFLLGSDSTKWASEVKAYDFFISNNIYSNIDVKHYTENNLYKYDFIIHPGGNPKSIKLVYEGLNGIYLKEGNLLLETSFNEVIEQKPFAYQIINGKEVEIPARYVLKGNILTYEIGKYDLSKDLIIDPTVVASTYSRSTETIYGHTATYDVAGNIYSAGAGFSPGGLPVTTGAYQISYRGSREMCINKYNATGSSLQYATYLGGANDDFPHSLFNYNGNLYILGSTESSNFPTTASAFDATYNGGNGDITVSVLSATGGGLLGSTYLGGGGVDGRNGISMNYGDEFRGEIYVDNSGNAYIASMTKSSNFPTTLGAVQTTLGGGQDGVSIKLNSTMSTLLFSTYLGGASDDAAYGILVDGTKTYVTGTAGSAFLTNTGAFGYSGAQDGFVLALNANASNIVNKSYFGASSNDQSYFIQQDLSGDIYILGQTTGSILATTGRYNGGRGLFVTKFNNTLTSREWTSTTKEMAPVAFLVDDCDYIYVSGHGGLNTLSGFGITSNAIQSTPAGLYLMVLSPQATNLSFGTYYGSTDSHVDGGTSRFDKRGVVYQATCTDDGFPTSPGAFGPSNLTGGSYDVTVFKIDFEISEIKAKARPVPDSVGCAPFQVSFTNTSGGNKYVWDFVDGSPTTNVKNPTHTFVNPGTYMVRLIAIDTNSSCIKPDTVYIKIQALNSNNITHSSDTGICLSSPVQLWANGASSYSWSPSTGLSNSSIANPVATPLVTTTYRVIGTSRCNTDTGYITITVNTISTSASNDTLVCLGSPVPLWAAGGANYVWSPTTGLSNPNISNPIATPGTTTTYTVTVTSAAGCSNTEQVVVNIQQGLPVPLINPDTDKCPLDQVTLTVSGGASYNWYSNYNIPNSVASSISVSQPITTMYYVDLTNVCGTVTDSVLVRVQKPTAISSPDDTVCYNDTVSLWSNGGLNYYWSPSNKVFNPNQANSDAYPVVPTTFSVVVEDNLGCKDTAYTNISFFPKPLIDAGSDKIVTFGESVELLPNHSDGLVYWTFDKTLSCINCTNTTATPQTTTIYTVNILDEYGCVTSDDVLVGVDGSLYVPNTFTPNGDGFNDVFYVEGEDITSFNLLIFDRWGQLIFETNDMSIGWDGKFKGENAKTDVYVWKVKYSDIDTPNQTKIGHVNLMR